MRELHGGCADPTLLDFSASLHPCGPPAGVRAVLADAAQHAVRYPSPDAGALCAALARHHAVPEAAVLAGNGAAELIYLVAQVLTHERVYLWQPCFAEYAAACRAMGAKLTADPGQAGACFAANPTSPAGTLLPRRELLRLPGLRIVDEAFMGFAGETESLIDRAARDPDLIVLRSLTKLYALPGLRLGYLIAHPERVAALRRRQPPWSVNGLAQAAGLAALGDPEHARRAPGIVAELRRPLADGLAALGLAPAPSHANYLLCRVASAAALCRALLGHGIAARDCSSFAGLDTDRHVRFAVRSRADNARLLRALQEITA